MTRLVFLFLLLASMFVSAQAQVTPPDTREAIDSIYELNIKKTRINGVYIPKDIDDAFEEFVHLSPEKSIQSFKLISENQAAKKLHFGIGRWMIVNWNFYEGSRLSHHLREQGLLHPDDMADFLITVFHRKLNEREMDTKALIDKLSEERKKKQAKMGKIYFN